MTFAEFQHIRQRVLRERHGVRDCAETNLYASLAHLIPPEKPAPELTVHRCHLAAEWVQRFGLPADTASRALISCGVRDSLALLFRAYAGNETRLWLPADTYPVYGELARAAGLAPLEFRTLPEPVWPDAPPATRLEILLVTNPLKPLGRWLTGEDVNTLDEWLAASSRRRLLLDVVYTMSTQFHPTTLQLLATGQTILLHSLTKGWLHPRLFGVALVPEADAATLTPLFRAHPPPQQNLARARELLGRHATLPESVASEIATSRTRLFTALPAGFPAMTATDPATYFMPVMGCWSALLDTFNVLGLPASVFGSPREDITILSSLSFVA